ncbi:MAG TPA: M1 family metallopeptidase [Chthoniobacterales bacterium]
MELRNLIAVSAACLLGFLTVSALAEKPFSFESTPGQLPKTIVPVRYEITLTPDVAKSTTSGSLIAKIKVLKPVREIILNALEMEVSGAKLIQPKEVALKTRLDPKKQTLTLDPSTELSSGEYTVALDFKGKIGATAQGLYGVKYKTPSGREKTMLATQMEATDCRRMFPCWDEPVYRAIFQLTVVVPEKQLAVSNTPVVSETPAGEGKKRVAFADTPSMASYLMAFCLGDFEFVESEVAGVKLRILTTEGKAATGQYALESTKKILRYFNDYFGTPYPLPKLDQIAIPGGFGGAMENWGAITYNENYLLFDSKTSAETTRRNVFDIVAHEIAHQWFGNIVTMAWWDNLWLNEGFASWMATKTTDHFNPEWEFWLNANADKNTAMDLDARKVTHPIQQPVATESQAMDAFDEITYLKGQAFIRMIENYLGENDFRAGIRAYMAKHRYSSTTTADLWNALGATSGKDVRALAANWTEQPGFPVVSVDANCADDKCRIKLRQARFVIGDKNVPNLQWQIPVAISTGADTAYGLLKATEDEIVRNGCNDVLHANAGDGGYFRVQYSPKLLTDLRKSINALPAIDRLLLLNDTWALLEAGRVPASAYFDLAAALKNERTLAIWQQILESLQTIDEMQVGSPQRADFQAFAASILKPQLEWLGWSAKAGESTQVEVLRGAILRALGRYGDPETVAEIRKRFAEFEKNPDSLPRDLREPVIQTAGRYADLETWETLHQLAIQAPTTEEKRLFYSGMQAVVDPALAKMTLELSLTSEMSVLDANRNVVNVARLGENDRLAWDFARENADVLLAKVSSMGRNGYFGTIVRETSDAKFASELEAFVKEKLPADALPETERISDEIRVRADFKKRLLTEVNQWISEKKSAPQAP